MGVGEPVIDLRNIEFTYPGIEQSTFENLWFLFAKGDKMGLVGHNGSGKSTLFHIIMGLLKPSSGEIRIFGDKIEHDKDFINVRRKIGLLFQDSDDQLFCPTVIEDIAFGPLNMGKSFKEAKIVAERTLEYVGLSGFENRITNKLSGGEKRLIAFASVLAMEPKLLLLDEPTTGLDEKTKDRMMEILKELNISYVLISHEHDFIVENTNSICSIQNGVIRDDDDIHFHKHVHAHVHGDEPHAHKD